MARKMFILGGYNAGCPDRQNYLGTHLMNFLRDENVETCESIDDPEELVKLMENDPDSAFVWCPERVPSEIYNFFTKDPFGKKIIEIYNASLGYLVITPTDVIEMVFCVNKTGKINAHITPKQKNSAA